MDPKSTNSNSHVLPTELWAWIFEIGAHIPACPTASPTELPFPLLVSRVSRHWRDVAINSPGVWTNVHWDISKPFPDIWFERSKSNLLDITLYSVLQPRAATDRLIPHMNRCFKLTFEAGDIYDLLSVIRPLKDVSALRLKHVKMCVEDDWEVDDWTQPHFLTGGTPNLSFMQLDAVCLQHAPPLVCVLSLDLHNWQPSRTDLLLLSTASSLTKLVLRQCTKSVEDDEGDIVVEIPSLLSLGIVPSEPSSSPNEEGSLLDYLSLPNLEYLEIVQATLPGLIEHFPIQHETPRYPKLQTLRLDTLELADDEDEEEYDAEDFFLLAFPTISHLQLINTPGEYILPAESIPSQMFHDAASSSMAPISTWPNLHTITLKTDLDDDMNWLYSMFLARNAMENPLQRIRLSDPPYSHSSQLYAFGRMRLESVIKVDVVGDDEIRGIVRQEVGSMESHRDLQPPTPSTSSSTEIFPTGLLHIGSPFDEFDTLFQPDGDIRDFAQWSLPDEFGYSR